MAFVEQEDILNEGLTRHLLKEIKGVEVDEFPRMLYDDAMSVWKRQADIRFGMFGEPNAVAQHRNFNVFNSAELVVGIVALGLIHRKSLINSLTGQTTSLVKGMAW